MTLKEIIKLLNSLPDEDKEQEVSFSVSLERLEISGGKKDNTDKTSEGEVKCFGTTSKIGRES